MQWSINYPPDGRHPRSLFFVQIFDLATKKGYLGPTPKQDHATTYSRLFLSRLYDWLLGYYLLVGPRLLFFVAKSRFGQKIGPGNDERWGGIVILKGLYLLYHTHIITYLWNSN